MSLTIVDVSDRLTKIDEVSLLEVLEISSEDLVQRFQDRIEERLESLEEDLSD